MFDTAARLFVALYLIAGGSVVAYVIAGRLLRQEPTHLRFCGTLIAAMGLSTAGFHALAPLRLFRLPWVSLALFGLLAATLLPLANRVLLARLWARDRRLLRRIYRCFGKSPHGRFGLAFAICALPVVLRPLALPPLGWDFLTYHGPKAALWVQQGGPALVLSDDAGTWAYYRNLFAGGEVFYAWALLPLREDLLPMLMQSVQWLSLGGCAFAMAREFGAREPHGSTAAGFLLAIPTVRLLVGAGYVDICVALCAAAAMALCVRLMKVESSDHAHRFSTGLAALAGVGLGLSCGVKLFALPTAAVALGLVTLRGLLLGRRRAILAAIAACVIFASPWIGYNLVDKGRPLWPFHIGIGGIALGAPESTRIAPDKPPPPAFILKTELEAAQKTFPLGAVQTEALGAPTLLPIFVLLGSAPFWLRRRPWLALLGLLMFFSSMAIFYTPIFNAMRLNEPAGISRYWLIALAAAIPASVWWCTGGLGGLYLGLLRIGMFYQLLRLTTAGHSQYDLDLMASIVVMVALLYAAVRRLRSDDTALLIGLCGGTLLFMYVLKERDANRDQAMRNDFVLDGTSTYWLPAAKALDDPEQTRRIAITAGYKAHPDHWFTYPLFGRRLQNRLFRIPTPELTFIDSNDAPARTAWLNRIAAEHTTHVMSFMPPSDELRWMEQMPQRFRRIAGQPSLWGAFAVQDEVDQAPDSSPTHSPAP